MTCQYLLKIYSDFDKDCIVCLNNIGERRMIMLPVNKHSLIPHFQPVLLFLSFALLTLHLRASVLDGMGEIFNTLTTQRVGAPTPYCSKVTYICFKETIFNLP